MNPFDQKLHSVGRFPLIAGDITTVQANISLVCNLQCTHCHWSCGPGRTEIMDWSTMQAVADLARQTGARKVDITGGEPSLHPELRRFIELLADDDLEITVRTNFIALGTRGNETLCQFLRDAGVNLIGSLPAAMDNNQSQRGRRTYQRSIECIRMLNALGYARSNALRLDLVYNPAQANLPPDQPQLEHDYRRELREKFDIDFSSLLTIANMPIGRFATDLQNQGKTENYRQMLRDAFNADTLDALMCRNQICIGWDGALADCDFNLALGYLASARANEPQQMQNRRIATGEHCFACTAGKGSSCGGALI